MAIYDFRCPSCGQVYEVTRPMSRAADPLECAVDGTPCERILNAAGFTKSSTGGSFSMSRSSASGWNHFGHSHGAGVGGHSHGDTSTPD